MAIGSIIKNIFDVANAIKKQVDLVKANKERCNRLLERINLILPCLKNLELIPDNQKYEPSLNDLNAGLEKALDFVSLFVGKNWLKRVFNAKKYNKQLDDININLQESCIQLGLAINVQQIFNREVDNDDQEKDLAFLHEKEEEIINLANKELQEIQKLQMNQEKRDEILCRQVDSVKKMLEEWMADTKADSDDILETHYSIPFCEICFDKFMGASNFGDIFLGSWDKQRVMVKMIQGNFTEDDYNLLKREAEILKYLKHPSIISFYGMVLDKQNPCLVLENLEKGMLSDVIKTKVFEFRTQKQIALEVLEGLQYLHKKDVVHGDLRCETIGLDKDGHAKLIDFGLSNVSEKSIATIKLDKYKTQFLAPELFLRGGKPIKATDIYNYGLFLLELFIQGKIPLKTALQYINELKVDEFLKLNLPGTYVDIITKCVAKKPEERPSLIDIVTVINGYKEVEVEKSKEDANYINREKIFKELEEKLEIEKNEIEKVRKEQEKKEQQFLKEKFEREREEAEAKAKKEKERLSSEARKKTDSGYLLLQSGIFQKKTEAYDLLLQAAEQHDSKAQYNLAMQLEYGDGVPKNLDKALFWYNEAEKNGDPDAKKRIAHVMEKLENSVGPKPIASNTKPDKKSEVCLKF